MFENWTPWWDVVFLLSFGALILALWWVTDRIRQRRRDQALDQAIRKRHRNLNERSEGDKA